MSPTHLVLGASGGIGQVLGVDGGLSSLRGKPRA